MTQYFPPAGGGGGGGGGYSPVFFVSMGIGFMNLSSTLQTIPFNTIENDPNNTFNTTTSTFTVPEDGKYHFDLTTRYSNVTAGHNLRIYMRVNGINSKEILHPSDGGNEMFFDYIDFDFSAGDTVIFEAQNPSNSGQLIGSFSNTKLSGYKITI